MATIFNFYEQAKKRRRLVPSLDRKAYLDAKTRAEAIISNEAWLKIKIIQLKRGAPSLVYTPMPGVIRQVPASWKP